MNIPGMGGGFGSPLSFGSAYGEVYRLAGDAQDLEARNILVATYLDGNLELDQQLIVVPEDVTVYTYLDGATVSQAHILAIDNLLANTHLDEPDLIEGKTLSIDNLLSTTHLDNISIAQDFYIFPNSIVVNTGTKLIDIVNWDDLSVKYGRYRNAYGASGNLTEAEIASGRIRPSFIQQGAIEDTDPLSGGRYKEQYKQTGRF